MKGLLRTGLVVCAVGLMLYAPVVCRAGEASASARQTETQPDGKLLDYIPPQATAALAAHPHRVFTSPEWDMFPREILTAQGKQSLGFDPVQITSILVVLEMELPNPPQLVVLAQFASPLDPEKVLPEIKEGTVEEKLEGRPYYRAENPQEASFFFPDQRTLLVGHDGLLRKMLANRKAPQPGKLSKMLADMSPLPDLALVMDFEPLRGLATAQLAMAPLAPEFASLRRVPSLLRTGQVKMNLVKNLDIVLSVQAEDEAAARQLEAILKELFDNAKEAMLQEMAENRREDDPVAEATTQYLQRVVDRIWKTLQPQRSGDTLTIELREGPTTQMAAIGITTGLLLPAVQSARGAARRAQSINNLKELGLAMHNYHDAYKRFPARANFDKEGKPLLSWRVHILPFVEQQALYDQFHLDEPWDSPHNRKLIERMPAVFQSPGVKTKPGMTVYLGLVGEGTLFEGDKKRPIGDIRDGTSNTIMLVEADPDRAVPWTKPDDLPFDPKKPLAGLGHARQGGFSVLFCDGSVRFISEKIDPEVFRRLALINDGEPVHWDKIER